MADADKDEPAEPSRAHSDNPVKSLVDRVRAEAPGLVASGRGKAANSDEAGSADEAGAASVSEPAADTNHESASDLLAQAIADVASHYGEHVAVASLTAGLALVKGRLPREHADDAAARVSLTAQALRSDPLKLNDIELPVLVFMRDGGVEILWRLTRDEKGKAIAASLSAPGLKQTPVDVPASELKAAATGDIMKLKPASGMDERGESAIPVPQGNWFLSAFRDSRHIYAEAIGATIAINVLALAMPLFSMNIYDRVLPNAAEATLWALAIGVMLAIAFDFIIRTLRAHFVDAASRRADVKLSALIYGRLLGARLSLRPSSAGVRANTMREFETLREFFNSATLTAFGDLPFLILFLVVIWIVAGPLVFVVAAAIPIVLIAGWLTQRALHKLILSSFQETAQKNAVVVETIIGMEAIKAAGAESWAAQKWERSVAEHIRTGLEIRQVSNLGQHVVQAIQTLVQVVVVIAGFYLVAAGQITMGALIAATILSGRALAPLAQAAMLLARLNQARIAYQSLSEIVAAPQERVPGAAYLSKTNFDGKVEFENVAFGYAEEAAPALAEFSTTIKPGERVAFLGGIGSGKTTALKLVQALYVPDQGRVLVDGISVSQIDPALLRRNVGLQLQGAELFHGTIRDNMTIGMPGATDRDILEAAHAAAALDWITRLPQGFDTLLRERGAGLSGGQRQSVALARALLGRPKIMLLDEPTSDMDGRTEQAVINRLKSDMKGRTLILVTHRPALLDLVDRIIVLEQGRKLEDGPKAEVLENLKAITRQRTRKVNIEAKVSRGAK